MTDERTPTGSLRIPTSTGAIRTLGTNPATAPIMLHPGDAIPARRRVLYIILLGALTALGPFTIDLYLPAFPQLESDFRTSAGMIQLTLTGTMIGFAIGQLVVGPLSDKIGRGGRSSSSPPCMWLRASPRPSRLIFFCSERPECSWVSVPLPAVWSRWRSSVISSVASAWS